MSDYEEILRANIFRIAVRFQDNTPVSGGDKEPQFSNKKITLHAPIPAGEYSLGIWQYADTMNLSLKLTAKPAQQPQQPEAQAPIQPDGDLDDFI